MDISFNQLTEQTSTSPSCGDPGTPTRSGASTRAGARIVEPSKTARPGCDGLDQPTIAEETAGLAATVSGAKIVPVSNQTASSFLARFDQRPKASPGVAIGAFEEGRHLIGIAALGDQRNGNASLTIVVEPARRKLQVGGDLLHAAVTEAASAGLMRLLVTYPAHAVAADALLRSSPFITAQRRQGGEVTTVVFVPTPPR